MVSMDLARWLDHKGMCGFMNNIGSDIANNNANWMTSFVSTGNQGIIRWAGFKNLEEVVAEIENMDLNRKADKMGDDRRRGDTDSQGPEYTRVEMVVQVVREVSPPLCREVVDYRLNLNKTPPPLSPPPQVLNMSTGKSCTEWALGGIQA